MFLKKFSINANDDDVEEAGEVEEALDDVAEGKAAMVHTQVGNKERDRIRDKRLPAEGEVVEEQEAHAPRPLRLFHREEDLEGDVQKRFWQTIRSPVRGR